MKKKMTAALLSTFVIIREVKEIGHNAQLISIHQIYLFFFCMYKLLTKGHVIFTCYIYVAFCCSRET